MCSKLVELARAEALWGTRVRVEPERSLALARTTRAEDPPRRTLAKMKKAARAQESLAERWGPEQALTLRPMGPHPMWVLAPQELRKPRLEPKGLLPELTRTQWKLQEPLVSSKNSVRPPQSLPAWEALGREVPFARQAFPAGGTSLPAWKLLARRTPVASKQD